MNNDPKREQCSCQVLVFSVRNSQTGRMPTSRTARDGPGAGPGGDDGRDPGRGPRSTWPTRAPPPSRCARWPGTSSMAPSALYRYFDGRDALLSALILAAYESLADEAERAADRAAATRRGSDAERWLAVPRALRRLGPRASARVGPHLRHAGARATRRPRTRSSPTPASPRPWCAPWSRRRRPAGCARTRPAAPVTDELRRRGGAGRRGALPDMPVEKVVLVVQAWTTDRRRHQPRGLRALAQHRPRPGPFFEATDPKARRGRSGCA